MKAGDPMSFYRDSYVEIDLNAVRSNIDNLIRVLPSGMKIMAVVKADAYGHGAVMIAREMMDAGIRHLAVATLDEALELRNNGLEDAEILVFGVIDPENLDLAQMERVAVSVNSLSWLKKARRDPQFQSLNVHLKLDSGMSRLGLTSREEVGEVMAILAEDTRFHLRGVYSHLATSEEPDDRFYQRQVCCFEEMLQDIDTTGLLVHIANSGGSLKPPPPHVNMVRIGLFLNGNCPGKELTVPFQLRSSLSLYSKIIQIKVVPPHTRIGYNGTYETEKTAIIGTLPIGYADGYDRRVKGGRVYVNGKYAKVVGRVCMDMTMIELEEMVEEGTLVEMIGPHVSLDEYCQWVSTSNYHATCAFSDRLPRVYKRDGKIVHIVNKRVHNHI
jgi:alanine racemase